MRSHSIGYTTTMRARLWVGTAHARRAGGGPRSLAANLGVGENFRAVYLATPMCYRADFDAKLNISSRYIDLSHKKWTL